MGCDQWSHQCCENPLLGVDQLLRQCRNKADGVRPSQSEALSFLRILRRSERFGCPVGVFTKRVND